MLRAIETGSGEHFAHDPSRRGYHAVYHPNEVNRCPGCGRSHWYVGRTTAECGFCATALPLVDPGTLGAGIFRLRAGWHPALGLAA